MMKHRVICVIGCLALFVGSVTVTQASDMQLDCSGHFERRPGDPEQTPARAILMIFLRAEEVVVTVDDPEGQIFAGIYPFSRVDQTSIDFRSQETLTDRPDRPPVRGMIDRTSGGTIVSSGEPLSTLYLDCSPARPLF